MAVVAEIFDFCLYAEKNLAGMHDGTSNNGITKQVI